MLSIILTEIDCAFDIQLTADERNILRTTSGIKCTTFGGNGTNKHLFDRNSKNRLKSYCRRLNVRRTSIWFQDATLVEDLTSHIEGFINMNLMEAPPQQSSVGDD